MIWRLRRWRSLRALARREAQWKAEAIRPQGMAVPWRGQPGVDLSHTGMTAAEAGAAIAENTRRMLAATECPDLDAPLPGLVRQVRGEAAIGSEPPIFADVFVAAPDATYVPPPARVFVVKTHADGRREVVAELDLTGQRDDNSPQGAGGDRMAAMDDLAMWLTQICDEDEAIAREASRHRNQPLVEGGEHWQWVCTEHDHVIVPDPLTQEVLECEAGWQSVSLRSVEVYPYESIPGEGPTFALKSLDEVNPVVAQHITRHDPAAVLARIAGYRQLLAEYQRQAGIDYAMGDGGAIDGLEYALRCLAVQHAHRPGYREDWRP